MGGEREGVREERRDERQRDRETKGVQVDQMFSTSVPTNEVPPLHGHMTHVLLSTVSEACLDLLQ